MRQPTHNTAKLPKQLLEELGVSADSCNGAKKRRIGPTNRQELRKAAKVQKNQARTPAKKTFLPNSRIDSGSENKHSRTSNAGHKPRVEATPIHPSTPGSGLDSSKPSKKKGQEDIRSLSPPHPTKKSRAAQERLAAEDAEIAALEKALGVKGKKQTPKAFKDDGLDSLFEGIDDALDQNELVRGKRKRAEAEDWLERKRRAAISTAKENGEISEDEIIVGSDLELSSGDENTVETESATEPFDGSDLASEEADDLSLQKTRNNGRENPYVAPAIATASQDQVKYVLPPLRDNEERSEDLSRLRRQMQGLLNRLSEANLTSILDETEKLYRNHPRQHVTITLLDLLMGLLSNRAILGDTFMILHAGFIAAIYKVIGTDFGAQVIQQVDEGFSQHYIVHMEGKDTGKILNNLIGLLTELYNLHVIDSRLIYDYVRLFIADFYEANTELLLRIVRNSGQQLRQDDPSSLKDIILQLQAAVVQTGEDRLSVRTKFMIETINDLKNNRMKTGVAATTITSEHLVKMRKILGALNSRSTRTSEPLRVGIRDLRERNKKGTWWVVGASYKGDIRDADTEDHHTKSPDDKHEEVNIDRTSVDLMQLAREQRMNTDVRRSIFIAVMSASDHNDAYVRLMKLRLKKSQEFEIPRILIHCAGAEKAYNPFYTHLSRRLCSDKKLKKSFTFSLWNLFKRMGDGGDEPDEDGPEAGEGNIELRCLVNLAKMYGILIAEGGLSLGVLKVLNLVILQPKTSIFVELLLITTILHSQRDADDRRNEKTLMDVFLTAKETREISSGLQYFLKKVVRKTNAVDQKEDKDTVKRACKLLGDALGVISTQILADE